MKPFKNSAERELAKSNEVVMATNKKHHYSKPVFQVYGAVSMLTMGPGGSVGDAGNLQPMSDINAKMNIVRIGDHPLGIGLYLFDYKPEHQQKWGHGRQFGVMAQEVETVMPEAVSVHPNGYKMVNYALLGISHRFQ